MWKEDSPRCDAKNGVGAGRERGGQEEETCQGFGLCSHAKVTKLSDQKNAYITNSKVGRRLQFSTY